MQVIIFSDNNNEKATLFHDKNAHSWKHENTDIIANHPPDTHKKIATFVIPEELISEDLMAYINDGNAAGGAPIRLLLRVIENGWEAGRFNDETSLSVNDLREFVDADIEGEISVQILLDIYNVARKHGAAFSASNNAP